MDSSTGEVRWRYDSASPLVGAVTTAAGDELFTGEVGGDFPAMNAVYATFFETDPPARATVEVARLPRDVLVEIAAIAGE